MQTKKTLQSIKKSCKQQNVFPLSHFSPYFIVGFFCAGISKKYVQLKKENFCSIIRAYEIFCGASADFKRRRLYKTP